MFIEILAIPVLFLLGLTTIFTIYWLVREEIKGTGIISHKGLIIYLLVLSVILSAFVLGFWYLIFLLPIIWLHLDYYDRFPIKLRSKIQLLWHFRMGILALMIAFNIHIVMRLMIANT